jgi:putative ABC transport system permease protein
VVGVARDGKYLAVFENQLPYFYVPHAQYFDPMRVLQIRSTVVPESLRNRLEREIQTLDPNVPITDLQPMARLLNGSQGFLIFRIGAIQAGVMGTLGLILALVGVYGVVSYGAAQRTREIGIRMALGATPPDVLRIVLQQGVWLVLSGLIAGLAVAVALTRVIDRILVEASSVDPWLFLPISLALALVALLACYFPARRAMRVDPTVALRHE